MADYLPQGTRLERDRAWPRSQHLVVKGLIVFAVVLVAVGIVVESMLWSMS